MIKAGLKFLAGLAALAALGVAATNIETPPGSAASAERVLFERTTAALTDAGFDWASVSIDGQKATLSGEAPSEEARAAAMRAVQGSVWNGGPIVGGVAVVDGAGIAVVERPPLADPFLWIAEFQGGALVLSGHAPSAEARNSVFARARMLFPASDVSGVLDVARGGPPEEDWLAAASVSLNALARLDEGAIEANGAVFTLSGRTAEPGLEGDLRRLMEALPAGVVGRADIETLAPPPPTTPPPQTSAIEDLIAAATAAPPAPTPEPPPPDANEICRARIGAIIERQRIGFASARSDVDADGREQLRALADALTECPQFRLEIIGHTDSSGGASRNLSLSQYRADAVAAFLAAVGVDASRLEARGVGASRPLVSNATPEGRERNRRIELNLLFDPQ